jgi:serine/threonine protein kinase
MFNVYDKGQASQLYNEILLLTSFQCDALITLKGVFHDEGSIGVIIEYMDKGSLEFIMEERVEMNERAMAGITFQILWGLGYLHYEKQIHRDVKPGNILMVIYIFCLHSICVKVASTPSARFMLTIGCLALGSPAAELAGPCEAVGLRHFEGAGQQHRHVQHCCGLVPLHVPRAPAR